MAKRKTVLLMIVFTATFLLPVLAGAQQRFGRGKGLFTEKKSLIVYLSRTNNTRAIGDIIHEDLGGKLIALELQTPYPSNLSGYRAASRSRE